MGRSICDRSVSCGIFDYNSGDEQNGGQPVQKATGFVRDAAIGGILYIYIQRKLL